MNLVTHRWPLMLVLLAAAFLGLTGWSVFRASSDVSGVDAGYQQQQQQGATAPEPLRAARP
jgi:hypothetical protein